MAETTALRRPARPVVALLGAPTNLGLRPPQPGAVPGCAKAPEALRDAGLHAGFVAAGAIDAGVVTSGRYVDDLVDPSDGDGRPRTRVRNQDHIVDYTRRLAGRIGLLLDDGRAPLLIGGDCSIVLAAGLALRRRGSFGLVHLDGHTDFRHPGNSAACGSVAGEDLAAAVGLHWPAVSDIDSASPYFDPRRVTHIGCRDDDEHLDEVRSTLALVLTATETMRSLGSSAAAADTLAQRATACGGTGAEGYWLHIDLDVIDPAYLPAVDSPAEGGLDPDQFQALVAALAPGALGAHVGIFDPDLDPEGRGAQFLAALLVPALADLGAATIRPGGAMGEPTLTPPTRG